MKTIITKTLLIFLLSANFIAAQTPFDEVNDNQGISDEALIVNKFAETIIKLGLYSAQLADRDLIILVCDTYAVPVQSAALLIGNPTFENIREYVIQNLLPDYSRQGTFLETIYDKELMRNVDQYIKYAETALNYGFNMTSADIEVRTYLSPEKGVWEEFEMIDGTVAQEPTYNGDTAAQYQSKITNLYQDISMYEPTGDPAVDDAVITAMTYTYFEDEENHGEVLDMIVSMNEVEFTGDPILDNEIMTTFFADFFENIEPDEIEEEAVIEEPGEQGYENGLNQLLADMGVGDRDPRNRYGEAAEPYYTEHATQARNANEQAQIALTNVFAAWEAIKLTEYAEKAIEMERLVRYLYENAENISVERLEELTGALKEIWDAIKNAS